MNISDIPVTISTVHACLTTYFSIGDWTGGLTVRQTEWRRVDFSKVVHSNQSISFQFGVLNSILWLILTSLHLFKTQRLEKRYLSQQNTDEGSKSQTKINFKTRFKMYELCPNDILRLPSSSVVLHCLALIVRSCLQPYSMRTFTMGPTFLQCISMSIFS